MMKFIVILALVGCAAAANKNAGKIVFDLLKTPLSNAEVAILLASRATDQYPTYDTIPQTGFNCASKAQPGFYADVETKCQVFHRCEQSGNQTAYLCANTTVFNQITLICDAWYNVDCANSVDVEDFANSRLYTNLPLFDNPPADYLAPSQIAAQAAAGTVQVQAKAVAPVAVKQPAKPAAKPAAKVPAKAAGREDTPAAPVAPVDTPAAPVAPVDTPVAAAGDAAAAGTGIAVAGRADSSSSSAGAEKSAAAASTGDAAPAAVPAAPAATESDDTAAAAPAVPAAARRRRFAYVN